MDKLEKDFNKVSRAIRDKGNIAIAISVFLEENKNNEVLKEYLKLLDQLKKVDEEISKAKTYMYEDMLQEDKKKLQNNICIITLKKPYEKTIFNLDKFLQDYSPKSSLYKKYIDKTTVKGNISIKILEE